MRTRRNNNVTAPSKCRERHTLYRGRLADEVLEELLPARQPKDTLLDGRCGDEPIHNHVARLPDAVATVLRLLVQLRVPVAVVEDNSVCCCQRNSKSTGVCGKEEDKTFWVRAKTCYLSLFIYIIYIMNGRIKLVTSVQM